MAQNPDRAEPDRGIGGRTLARTAASIALIRLLLVAIIFAILPAEAAHAQPPAKLRSIGILATASSVRVRLSRNIPTVCFLLEFVEAGELIAYSANTSKSTES